MDRAPWLALSAALLVACTPSDGLGPEASSLVIAPSERADLHFKPLDLRAGDTVTAAVGPARLTSTARTPDRHEVEVHGGAVRALVGLLDGAVAWVSTPGSDGGATDFGPTSVHRLNICGDDGCHVRIEYDYDLRDPDGNGSTSWRTPDGGSATIDRLRVELDQDTPDAALRLTTPQPAVLVGPPVIGG